jgi:UDP-N-acetylmuramoylalanine--D-glutamate ligase
MESWQSVTFEIPGSGNRPWPGGSDLSRPELSGMNVVVVGLGSTGEATVEFLVDKGARVVASDIRTRKDIPESALSLSDKGVSLELGGHEVRTFTSADLIVLSPGVPPDMPPLVKARKKGVAITGEIELASQFITAPIVAVTGTNGKTTTTSLAGEILAAAGLKVFVGGNIGRPLIRFAHSAEFADAVVIELSSFQLETVDTLHPKAAALLNVTPDHLDRYTDAAEYFKAKTKVFSRQTGDDFAIMNADDIVVDAKSVAGQRLEFSRIHPVRNGAYLDSGRIVLASSGRTIGEMPLDALSLVGAHNHENVMAAICLATAMGVDPQTAFTAASEFKGLPHRLEFVAEVDGVRYYDDSKGTNVGAVMKSLESFDQPIILIAGGREKDTDFSPLADPVYKRVKLLILLGEAREKLADALGGDAETLLVSDMAQAVKTARRHAEPGDVVLLSPACASFDMFQDYAHRGRVFTDLVRGKSQ